MNWEKLAIDLSHHQVIPVDLSGAAKAGICAVVHKATQGKTMIDEKYGARRFLAAQQDLKWGAYHFFSPPVAGSTVTQSIKDQGEWFLKYAKPDDNTLLALDHEDKRCSLSMAIEFMQYVEGKLGRNLVIYSGHVLREQLEKSAPTSHLSFLRNHRLWHAQYSTKFKVHSTWERPWLWQNSETGKVPGIKGNVDTNLFFGNEETLRKEWV